MEVKKRKEKGRGTGNACWGRLKGFVFFLGCTCTSAQVPYGTFSIYSGFASKV